MKMYEIYEVRDGKEVSVYGHCWSMRSAKHIAGILENANSGSEFHVRVVKL